MFLRTARFIPENYYNWIGVWGNPPLKGPPRPAARPITHELESTGAVGWFAREYPYAAMITNLRARRHKHYCELYVSALDLTIYFYPGRVLDIITDHANVLQAFDMDAYTYVFDVILPATILDLLPQPIAEEITPELWTRTQRVQLPDSESAENYFSDFVEFDPPPEGWDVVDINETAIIHDENDRPPEGWDIVDRVTTAKDHEDNDDDYYPKYTAWDYRITNHPSGSTMYTIDTRQYTKRRDNWGTHTGRCMISAYYDLHSRSRESKFNRGHFLSNYTICDCDWCYTNTNRRDIPAKYDDFPLVINLANYYIEARVFNYARDRFDDSDIDWGYE